MNNPFTAYAAKFNVKNGTVTMREFSKYPSVPADWPSRSVRRAVRFRRTPTAPGWQAFMATNPMVRPAVMGFAG